MKMNNDSRFDVSVVSSLVFDNGFEYDENSDDYRFEQFSIFFNKHEVVFDDNELCMLNLETGEFWTCNFNGLNVLYEIIENELDLDFGFERL